jgi:hypothetical protein
MVYRPTFRKQGDGSSCQWANCGPASVAMASQRAREGKDPANQYGWPPTPKEIRQRIAAKYGTGCKGTTFAQNEYAAALLYKVDMQPRYQVPWSTFISLIKSGRGAQLAIQYSVVAPTKFDASPGFTGGHSVFVNEVRTSDGAFLVYDPLADGRRAGIPKGPQWWPGSLVKAAAFAYPGTNVNCLHASFTIDTE